MKKPSNIRVNLRYNEERYEKALKVSEQMKKAGIYGEPDESKFFWTLLDMAEMYFNYREKAIKEYLKLKEDWNL